MSWTDSDLITKDPRNCPHTKKKHIDELVFSNPSDEVQEGLKDLWHRAMEWAGKNPSEFNVGWWQFFWDRHSYAGVTPIIRWDEEKKEVVSNIKAPPENAKVLTPTNSTFITLKYLSVLRYAVHQAILWTKQSLKEVLTGEEREGYNCPRCNPTIGVLSTEQWCSSCLIDWELKNGKWQEATWTNPILHVPLVFELQQDYPKGTTEIAFTGYPYMGRAIGIRTLADLDGKKGRPVDYIYPHYPTLDAGVPVGSFLVFDNHYAQYVLEETWKEHFDEDEETGAIINHTGYYPEEEIEEPILRFKFAPPLKFDVKKGSHVQLFLWQLAQTVEKGSKEIIIDSKNYFWMDLEEVSKKRGQIFARNWGMIDGYFSRGTHVTFREGNTYTIKNAEITSSYDIKITLFEKIKKEIKKGTGLFLATMIEAKHLKEIRNALDNLTYEGDMPAAPITAKPGELGFYIVDDVKEVESLLSGSYDAEIDPDTQEKLDNEEELYGTYYYTIVYKVTVHGARLKGVPKYIYKGQSDWIGNRRAIWYEQVVGSDIVQFYGLRVEHTYYFVDPEYHPEFERYILDGDAIDESAVCDGIRQSQEILAVPPYNEAYVKQLAGLTGWIVFTVYPKGYTVKMIGRNINQKTDKWKVRPDEDHFFSRYGILYLADHGDRLYENFPDRIPFPGDYTEEEE